MKVNEIFYSIEGEGTRTGYPCVFIRLYGCNLKCSYCDTRYSCEGDEYEEIEPINVADRVKREYGECHRVTITGGEPLIQSETYDLVRYLLRYGYEVNIETNGSVLVDDYLLFDNVIVTMDYKSLSSGMNSASKELNCGARLDLTNMHNMRRKDVLKCVVGSREDMEDAYRSICLTQTRAQVFFSPIYGMIEPKEIVEFIKEKKMVNARVQVQLHKVIWDVNKRGV